MGIKNRLRDVDALIFVTFVALFSPIFMPYFGLLLEQLLTALLCFMAFIFLSKDKRHFNTGSVYISFIFMSLLLISVLRSFDVLIINDLFEIGKPIYFFLFFTMAYSIQWDNTKIVKYFSSLMILLFLGALIGIGEGTTYIIEKLTSIVYKEERGAWFHKAIFSFISPYTFATVLLLPIFYNFIKLMRPKNKTIVSDMLIFFIFLSCFILTQSRTIFISFILTFIIFFLFVLFNKWYPARNKIIFCFISVIAIIVISIPFIISYAKTNLPYLYGGLNVVIKHLDNFNLKDFVYSNKSTAHRFDQILFAIEHQDRIPLVGVGIGKSLFMPESLYAMYYYRTGLIGTCIHFALIFYVIYWALYFSEKYAKLNSINRQYFSLMAIFFAIAIYFISFVFDYLSSAVNDQTRSGFIFYTLVAIVCYYKNHYRVSDY
jgi:hypothetical protein